MIDSEMQAILAELLMPLDTTQSAGLYALTASRQKLYQMNLCTHNLTKNLAQTGETQCVCSQVQ